MITNEAYLTYIGNGKHSLVDAFNASKTAWLANLSYSDNRKVSEWALDAIEYRFREQHMREVLGLSSEATHDYFSKIHADYEQDLRERHFVQDPVISDAEAAELIAEPYIKEALEELAGKKEFTLTARV